MSFILDALKKSEERRQQETAPGVKKRVLLLGTPGQRRWPIWLLIVLLPTALLAGWWLGRSPVKPLQGNNLSLEQPQAVSAPQPKPEGQRTEIIAPQAAPRTNTQPAGPAGKQNLSAQSVPAQPAPPETPAVTPAPVPIQPAPPAPAKDRRAESSQSAAETAEPVDQDFLPTYDELSADLRNRLPELDISLHFYSANPARRMVRINGSLLHEGAEVADGLTIYEITPSSTIFDYLDMLFEIPGPGK